MQEKSFWTFSSAREKNLNIAATTNKCLHILRGFGRTQLQL